MRCDPAYRAGRLTEKPGSLEGAYVAARPCAAQRGAGSLLLLRGEHEILAPNQIFFEMILRGKENRLNPNRWVTAASEGLGHLSGEIGIRKAPSP